MLEKIKKLRELTGAGMVEVKKAIEEAGGDEAKACDILRKKGQEKASKKSDRVAGEGVVASYVHSNSQVGALVKLMCETDFVARNDEFKALAYDIAMHVAAMNPKYIKKEDAPQDIKEKEKEEMSLLSQPFVKNPDQTVGDLITEMVGKIGENIQVGEFYRMEL